MPAAWQNGAETTDTRRYPDDAETGSHQESGSWLTRAKRLCKQHVAGSNRLRVAGALCDALSVPSTGAAGAPEVSTELVGVRGSSRGDCTRGARSAP
jgi:hypothetical protein